MYINDGVMEVSGGDTIYQHKIYSNRVSFFYEKEKKKKKKKKKDE